MKKLSIFFWGLTLALGAVSCQKPDSEIAWGDTLIYMPQANYNPYLVPNGGTDVGVNKNYRIDEKAGKVHIFLGVYRSGLAEFLSYDVDVSAGTAVLAGTTLLPAASYTLPSTVSCPAGKRDVGFYLSVDIDYLAANATTDFSLEVTISNPTRYSLNEELVTTRVSIDTSALIAAEDL